MTILKLTGSDLSGNDGNSNRTYTISSNATDILVWVGGLLFEGKYTYSSGTLTFTSSVYNESQVIISYTDSSTESLTYYTTNLKIVQVSGIGISIQNESLGTGDGSTASFDLDNGNVIEDSYTIKYSDSSTSNDFTELIENTDYTLDLNGGTVLLTATGLTKTDGKSIFIDYTHSPEVNNDVITLFNKYAKDDIDKSTANYWGSPKDNYQIFDWENYDYPNTERPYINTVPLEPETLQLKYKGINTITGAYILNTGTNFSNAQSYDSVLDSYTDNSEYVNKQTTSSFYPFASTPASSDYLYLGANNMFHSINTINAVQGVLSTSESNIIEYYDGTDWLEIDSTESNTGTLNFTTNGKVSWDRLPSWTKTTINSSGSYYFVRIKNLNTYSTVPKTSMIYPGQDFIIGTELELSQITFTDWGEVNFFQNTLINGKQKVRVDFNHGYDTVPALVEELAGIYASIRSLVRISGGSYSTPSTYTLGRFSVSIGQLYVNISESIKQLKAREQEILDDIGRKMDVI